MSREILLSIQEDRIGGHLFHGSIFRSLVELRPNQAFSHNKPDGTPAVFASSSIDPAIFMAVLGKRGKAGWDNYLYGDPFGFYVAESSYELAQAEHWQGSVYVVNSSDFDEKGLMMSRSTQIVPVVCEVNVCFEDLLLDHINVIGGE